MSASVGDVLDVKVEKVLKFGALVSLPTGERGLIHISQIANAFVQNVEDHLSAGQTVKAKVTKIGEDGKIDLSIKALAPRAPAGPGGAPRRPGGPARPEKREGDFAKKDDDDDRRKFSSRKAPPKKSEEVDPLASLNERLPGGEHRDPQKSKERDRTRSKYSEFEAELDNLKGNDRSLRDQLEDFKKYME